MNGANMTCVQIDYNGDKCTRPIYSRDLCSAHYQRLQNGYDMQKPLKKSGLNQPQRFCKVVDYDGNICNKPTRRKTSEFCEAHYWRNKNKKDMREPIAEIGRRPDFCQQKTYDGSICGRPVKKRSYCSTHYNRFLNNEDMLEPIRERRAEFTIAEPCKVEGCEEPQHCQKYCKKHYGRFYNEIDVNGESPHRKRNMDEKEFLAWIDSKTIKRGKCKIWQGHKDINGYGRTHYNDKSVAVHRIVLELHHGIELTSKDTVCHLCNNRDCVSIDCLQIADAPTNQNDTLLYENHKGRKLNAEKAEAIRASSKSPKELAKQYNVSLGAVYNVLNNKTWKQEDIDAARERKETGARNEKIVNSNVRVETNELIKLGFFKDSKMNWSWCIKDNNNNILSTSPRKYATKDEAEFEGKKFKGILDRWKRQ